MEALKKIYGSIWGKLLLITAAVVAGFLLRTSLESGQDTPDLSGEEVRGAKRSVDYAEMVAEDHVILQAFRAKFPDAEVLLACEEDVTDDGRKDLVVICRLGDLTRTVVVSDCGGRSYSFSEPIPAPVENQKIQFKNIDKEGEIEIIITGEKKGAVGYAIYRMIDGEPVDLFGEGMEDCC